MNRITKHGLWILVAALPLSVRAGEQQARMKNEDTWTGTLTAVDAQGKTITAKRMLFSKTFNLGEHCAISAVDKKDAALSDLRPGEDVRIRYQDVEGVLVADQIAERALHYSGRVQQVDQGAKMVTMQEPALYKPFKSPRAFRMAEDCKVILSNGRDGTLADLQPGDRISVVYELPGSSPVAYRISNKSATFVGTVAAIDLSAGTLQAKEKSNEKKFDLADHCQVVLSNEKTGRLKDLMVGQKCQFTYEDVNGVNVLDRIGPVPETKAPETASTR